MNRTWSPGRSWAHRGTGRRDRRRRPPGSRRSSGGRARNTSGCPSGGTWTAPSTIPSLGSSPVPRTLEGRPGQPQPDPVGVRCHGVRRGRERQRARPRPEPVARGPGSSRSGPAPVRSGARRAGPAAPGAGPTGKHVARAEPGRPRPASVSVDREPSTGATSMPPATATYAAHALPGRPEDEHRPRRAATPPRRTATGRRRRVTGHGAPVTATSAPGRRGARRPPSVVSRTAASGGLPTSRLASAAAGASRAPAAGHPEVGVARAGHGPGRW